MAVVVIAIAALALLIMQLVKSRNGSASAESPIQQRISGESIAVFPFDNFGRDPDNAYFADGIQEEILYFLFTFC